MTGWHSEAFARQKTVKDLGEYLKPVQSTQTKREQDAWSVKRMFDRMIHKQGDGDGHR